MCKTINNALDTFRTDHKDRIPGSLMFLQVAGSQSYNLALPDSSSDYDFLGVFVRPTHEILQVNPPSDHANSKEGSKPDFQLHEVGKFASLMAKGNPTIVEMAFADPATRIINEKRWLPEWMDLVEHRNTLLNQRTLKQYMGYAQGQWRRLVNGQPLHTTGSQYSTKWAYHVVRLLKNAYEIVCGHEPTIRWEGENRDELLNIRNGHYTKEEVEIKMSALISNIESLKPWDIPAEPDMEWINNWLFNVRRLAMA